MAANVPAVVVGWEGDDGLRVRLVEPLGGIDTETEISARPASAKRGHSEVDIQKRRHGLRVGGVVVLLKAAEAEGGLVWRGIDTLREKADVHDVRIFRRTPVTIFPPPEGTSIVQRAAILLASSAVSFTGITFSYEAISLALEEGCLYGHCGLLLRGPDRKGNVLHHFVPPPEEATAQAVTRILARQRLETLYRHARNGRGSWKAIPYVEMKTDQLRSNRMSADRLNVPYALPDGSPGFKLCTVAIRYVEEEGWLLSDATPLAVDAEVFGMDAPEAVIGLTSVAA